jgi:uncharacterized cupin superfamily protein
MERESLPHANLWRNLGITPLLLGTTGLGVQLVRSIGLFLLRTRQTPVKSAIFLVDNVPMSVLTKPHTPKVSTASNGSFVPSSAFKAQTPLVEDPSASETLAPSSAASATSAPSVPLGASAPATADVTSTAASTEPSATIAIAPAPVARSADASIGFAATTPQIAEDIQVTEENPWMTELELIAVSPVSSVIDSGTQPNSGGPNFGTPGAVEAALALDQKLGEIEQALKEEAQLLASKAKRSRESIDDARDDALIGLESAPLPASWLLEGDPSPRIKIMTCSPEGGLLSGVWTCRAARFRFDYTTFDETVHIIRGVAEVRIGDEITHLRAGSIAYFPRGASSEWTVHEPIHKYFVQRNSNRGVRKIRALIGRFRRTEVGGLG